MPKASSLREAPGGLVCGSLGSWQSVCLTLGLILSTTTNKRKHQEKIIATQVEEGHQPED